MQAMLREIVSGISAGNSFSEQLRRYPRVFDRFYVSLVEVGETSGQLPSMMKQLAVYIEGAEFLNGKVRGALYYPITVLVFGLMIVAGIVAFALPRLQSVYQGLDVQLPLATRAMIALGNFVATWWWALALVVLAVIYGIRRLLQTRRGRYTWDNFKLQAPIYGSLSRRLAISRFAHALATLYHAGVPLRTGLEVVAACMDNVVLEGVVVDMRRRVEQGGSLVDLLRGGKLFTPTRLSACWGGLAI